MKVLLINKYHYIKGGSETYFFGLKKMLEDNGHTVIIFSMKDDKNFQSVYEDYFAPNVDYEKTGLIDKIHNAVSLIYSSTAYKKLCRLINDTGPDVAHVNLVYHQLSNSIFHALKRYNLPTVYTSHDYKIICPNYKCYNKTGLCTKCYGGKYHNCVLNKCHQNSFVNSFIVAMEAYFHKFKKSYNIADKIISPSNFMHRQLIKGGLEEDKLICLPNFIPDKLYDMQNGGFKFVRDRTVLYYGRLAAEKGIDVLLEAKKLLPGDVQLKIIGTGPEEEKLKKRVDDEAIPNIQFLGFRQGFDLYQEIKSSKCTLLPSIWNEVFGLTVIESYCLGTPVIGSDIGGIQEIIKDGRTGFLSKCNDPRDFAGKINKLLTMPQNKYEAMVLNCLEEKKRYSPQQYYHSLLGIYNSIANSNSEAQARKRG